MKGREPCGPSGNPDKQTRSETEVRSQARHYPVSSKALMRLKEDSWEYRVPMCVHACVCARLL